MKLIKPSYSIIEPTGYTIDDIYKSIELAGKVSHKSEHTIKEGSAKDFVDRMIKLGHGATLEFGTVYLDCPQHVFTKYIDNPYSKCKYIKSHIEMDEEYCSSLYYTDKQEDFFVTTNMRVLVENNWLGDLKYLCEPTEYHHKRYTVKFILDRGILAEFTRHRKFSFMAESTRYCNYSKDRFGNELTFIKPCWLDIPTGQYVYWDGDWCDINKMKIQLPEGEHKDIDAFLWTLNSAEAHYTLLINSGWKPQEARTVLPNSLKTELYMCGFAEDWKKFFELRCAPNSHPQARELAIPLREEFIKRGYISEQQDN